MVLRKILNLTPGYRQLKLLLKLPWKLLLKLLLKAQLKAKLKSIETRCGSLCYSRVEATAETCFRLSLGSQLHFIIDDGLFGK